MLCHTAAGVPDGAGTAGGSLDDIKGQFIDINGIKTLVTHSCKDLFVMLENHEQEEVDKAADNVLQDVISAKRYVETLKH